VLPELVGVVGAGSFEQGGGRFAHLLSRQGCRLADELEGAWGRPRVHAQVAQQPGYDGYLGVEAAMAGDGCERKFQHALTVEVEAWREKQLDAKVLALRVHDRRRLCYRAIKGSRYSVAWVTAWSPSPAVSMPPWQPVHRGGMACRRGATPAAAPHRLATAEQGQGVGVPLLAAPAQRIFRFITAWRSLAQNKTARLAIAT
jgi:hypothetical protein